MGVVLNSGINNDIQSYFDMEGYFSIKVTPLGENIFLLEEVEEGAIKDLILDGCSWWSQWFSEIKGWRERNVDKERNVDS